MRSGTRAGNDGLSTKVRAPSLEYAGDEVRAAAALWWLSCHCRPAAHGPENRKVSL